MTRGHEMAERRGCDSRKEGISAMGSSIVSSLERAAGALDPPRARVRVCASMRVRVGVLSFCFSLGGR
eukprot:6096189-Prymnesium_polylepis.1